MGNIVLLDDLTINKIAAGEVIERPASVVKEMVENSIDAGADNITIEIKNGGITYIKITDNGKGIPEDDLEIAFERHATSKIRKADDLEIVRTMGFRGEALASIAAIANVELISKTESQETGFKVVVEGGEVLEKEVAGCSKGTTITVKNLFFNTPVRYKFLKKDYTETGYIEDVITRISLIHPEISFKLINTGKTIIQTTGNRDLKSVIYSIYGKNIAEAVLNVSYNYDDMLITGVVGKPEIARSNRSQQLFFVNKRYIKDKTLSSAVEQAFKGMLPIGKFGFVVLNISMSPRDVDVNVHPAKLEVRFEDESKVFKAIYHAIRNTLLKGDLISDTEKEDENSPENVKKDIDKLIYPNLDFSSTLKQNNGGLFRQKIQNPIIEQENKKQNTNIENKVEIAEEITESIEPTNKQEKNNIEDGNNNEKLQVNDNSEIQENNEEEQSDEKIKNQKENELIKESNANGDESNDESNNEKNNEKNNEDKNEKSDDEKNSENEKLKEEADNEIMPENEELPSFEEMYAKTFNVEYKKKDENKEVKEDDVKYVADIIKDNVTVFENLPEYQKPQYRFIGIAFKTYIIIEMNKELYILDQHAAHERIMYEKIKENYYSSDIKDSQLLLLPDLITLTHKEMNIALENKEMFEKAGFILEEFGENTIKLSGVPEVCIDLNTRELFLETLDEINSVARTAKQEIEERFIATVACKAAVKANMELSKEEVESLMDKLLTLPNPFTCPHGRPTAIKMTQYDIERKFARK